MSEAQARPATRQQAASTSSAVRNPVFILGLHRSGTTILYEMLSAVKQWNTLWAWHIANYDQIRAGGVDHATSQLQFTDRLRRNGMETRGVDSIKAGPETKEEYCFILDNLGHGNRISRKGLPAFNELCETVQSTFTESRPLLLKNPWDFGNAPLIHELIPSARFVFIHRHPKETISSMWRLMHSVFEKPHPWLMMLSQRYEAATQNRVKRALMRAMVCRTPALFIDSLIWWTKRQCDAYLRSISRLPQDVCVEVTYQQLCNNPNETLARIRERLEVPDNGVDFSGMISPRQSRCDERIERRAAMIERKVQNYLARMKDIETAQLISQDSHQPTRRVG
jgi:hypothetical protein